MGFLEFHAVQRIIVDITGTNDLITAVPGKSIRVLAAMFSLGGTDPTLKLQSGGAAALTGVMDWPSGDTAVLPFNEAGWFQTAVGAKLDAVQTGAGATCDGFILYQLV